MNAGQNNDDGPEKSGPSKLKRFRLNNWVLFIVVTVACFLFVAILASDEQRFEYLSHAVERISLWLMFARLTLIALAWWYWNPIVDWIYKGANRTGVAPLKAKRHFLALFFIVFELVVVQKGLSYFVMFAD